MDDTYQQFIKQFLASNKAEALNWLRAGTDKLPRNMGEMEPNESVEFVQRLYGLGAEKVLAVEIDEYPEGENTAHLLVLLPVDDVARAGLFAFERQHAEAYGFEGTSDGGQEYLYFKMD